jgi:hypothetical protein
VRVDDAMARIAQSDISSVMNELGATVCKTAISSSPAHALTDALCHPASVLRQNLTSYQASILYKNAGDPDGTHQPTSQ